MLERESRLIESFHFGAWTVIANQFFEFDVNDWKWDCTEQERLLILEFVRQGILLMSQRRVEIGCYELLIQRARFPKPLGNPISKIWNGHRNIKNPLYLS